MKREPRDNAVMIVRCTECDAEWVGNNCGHVPPDELALLVRVALGVVKRRRLRGQARVYDDPIALVEAVAKKWAR